MDTQSNILNLETLFPSEIKDVQIHLNHVYENSCANNYSLKMSNLEQDKLNSSELFRIKNEPVFHHVSNDETDIQNHLNNASDCSSLEINKGTTNNLSINTVNPSHSSISTDQISFLNHDPYWNRLIQSKINVPLNSSEGQTEIMLMILKALNDNKILISNISKRLEKLESYLHLHSSQDDINTLISNQNEIPLQSLNTNSSSKIFELSNQNLPSSNLLLTPMENDFHLHQFENNINSPSFQSSVIQFLRQKIGGNIRETVRRMIFALITPDFSLKFNRTGANNKYAFKLKLEPLIKEAVISILNCSERDVEVAIVRTLKETKDKFSSRKK